MVVAVLGTLLFISTNEGVRSLAKDESSLNVRNTGDEESSSSSTSERRRRMGLLSNYVDPRTTENVAHAPPPPGPPTRPNILFLILDQCRPDWDGHHFHTRTGPLPLNMPFLTELGRHGTRFTQAYVPSPFCGPSRACLAFGMEYDYAGVMGNQRWSTDHTQWTTVYKLLRDVGGYHTMTCGKVRLPL